MDHVQANHGWGHVSSLPFPSTFLVLSVKPESMRISRLTLSTSEGLILGLGRRLHSSPGRAWGDASSAAGAGGGMVIFLSIAIPVSSARFPNTPLCVLPALLDVLHGRRSSWRHWNPGRAWGIRLQQGCDHVLVVPGSAWGIRLQQGCDHVLVPGHRKADLARRERNPQLHGIKHVFIFVEEKFCLGANERAHDGQLAGRRA